MNKFPVNETVKVVNVEDVFYEHMYIGAVGKIVPLEDYHKDAGFDYSVSFNIQDGIEECIGFKENELELYIEPPC